MITPKNYRYIGTITFNGNYELASKMKIISNLETIFQRQLDYSGNEIRHFDFEYTIEYHKVENQDDYEAPHIHFSLLCQKKLSKIKYENLLYRLKQIGRSQLYLATSTKYVNWKSYMLKDVKTNETKFNTPHHFKTTFTNTPQEIYSDLDNL